MAMAMAMAMERAMKRSELTRPGVSVAMIGLTKAQIVRRAALVLATIAMSYAAFANAVAEVASGGNPDLALRFVPSHALALATKADLLIAADMSLDDLREAEALAQLSIESQAVNPRALKVLGYVRDLKGKPSAISYLMMSDSLSRRELGTQLWLIEDCVAKGDLDCALRRYDIALRGSSQSAQLLLPVLTAALADPAVQRAFVPYLQASPSWLPSFMSFAMQQPGGPVSLAEAIGTAGGLPSDPQLQNIEQDLLRSLADQRDYASLRSYLLTKSDVGTGMLVSAALTQANTIPGLRPLTWSFVQSPSISAVLDTGAAGNSTPVLKILAGSGSRGVAASKLLYLGPGTYRLTQNHRFLSGGASADARFVIACLLKKADRTIWDGPLASRSGVDHIEPLVIPENCPVQSLTLLVAGGDSQNGLELDIDSITVARVNG